MRAIAPIFHIINQVTSIILLFATLCYILPGESQAAAEGGGSSNVLWKWQERYVRIEPQDISNAPRNEHPINFTPQQIGIMLDALRVVTPQRKKFFSRNKGDPQEGAPVFADRELEVLSDALSRGLAKVGPREEIVFITTGNYNRAFGGILKERTVNTGRVFFVNGKLNIIFGEIRGKFSEARGAGSMVAYPAVNPVPGSRQSSVKHEWEIVLEPGISLYEKDRLTRSDWVLIDPDTTVTRYQQKLEREAIVDAARLTPLAEETERLAAEQEELRRKVRQLEQDAQSNTTKVLKVPPSEVEKTTTTRKAAAMKPTPAESLLEQRLKILKRLLDQGLVSVEIYNTKVKELLDENL